MNLLKVKNILCGGYHRVIKMINGKLPVTWLKKDYSLINDWRSPESIYNHVHSTNKIKKQYVGSAGVFICNEIPKTFNNIIEGFKLKNTVAAINKLMPGQVLPWHTDNYPTYIRRNNISENQQITRIIVFLHDQEPGQQLWIGHRLCVGTAGTDFGWGRGVEHMAANLSKTPRYTLQITGVDE